jgi:hypothetical protein
MTKELNLQSVIEPLRRGIPPRKGVRLYSTGYEKLIEGIKKHHLELLENNGIIRFISGSWGAGKTHFFRLLSEIASEQKLLICNVELDINSVALNKMHSVYSAIVNNIRSPLAINPETEINVSPFACLIREAFHFLAYSEHKITNSFTFEALQTAKDKLHSQPEMDIDFKRMILHYWESMVNDDEANYWEQETMIEWFAGAKATTNFKKKYEINKNLTPQNVRIMLRSLAGFAKLAGYKGILILFDEAEQSYSVMRKSALREAQNNLLSLINNIQALPGIFLIYATTPDFYTDPRHGIEIYGALAQRIGMPRETPPRALDLVWNFDAIEYQIEDFQTVAKKIAAIYKQAYQVESDDFPHDDEICDEVKFLFSKHPNFAALRFWRLMISYLITHFDDLLEGNNRNAEERYHDVIESLRES